MKIKSILIFLFLLSFQLQTHAQHTWKGSWICLNEDQDFRPAPLFRKSITLHKAIKSATLLIVGLGQYQLSLNGRVITRTSLSQSFTKYNTTIRYQNYPLKLEKGENVIGVELGNGWYNMQSLTIWNFDKIAWRKSPRMIADLIINYTDGTTDTIGSDPSWKCNTGASQFNSMHAGEIYDARQEQKGWDLPGFNDQNWKNATLAKTPGGKLILDKQPPVVITRSIQAKSVVKQNSNTYLFDLGENIAGVAEIKVKGKRGDSVILTSDELLNPDGSLNIKQNSGQMIGPNTDPKFQSDIYILKGGGEETFAPRFTYHGFRYVQVKVPAHITLTKLSLQAKVYRTGFKRTGYFTSSDPILNKLYSAAIRSYESNFVGIPTDCPQREKMGWLADAHTAAALGLWHFDASSSYSAYLQDIRDVQLENGKLPGIAPTQGVGYSWIDPEDNDFGPAWGSALPLLTWENYLHSGQESIIKENYPSIKKYLSYLQNKAEKTGNLYTTGIADWQALEATPKAFTSTAIYYHDLVLAGKMAGILKLTEEEQAYQTLAGKAKKAFNEAFFDEQVGAYKTNTVTALSAALYFDLVPQGAKSKVAKDLAELIIKKQYQTDFGIFGTKYVLRTLCDYGYGDIAYKLLTNTNSGWGKWMASGSTTLWEEWPGTTSHNHVYAGDYGAWFFEYLGGIKINETKPGLKAFIIDPVFPKKLNSITLSHSTAYGAIHVSWKRIGKTVAYKISIPKGSKAQCKIKGHEQTLSEGLHQIKITN